ncbi:fasciclin domain-containing protein [Puteibacter caeruleilacunae]|nr:fasciclin domain-containing protein [Puteibacter caeruleilacunae]
MCKNQKEIEMNNNKVSYIILLVLSLGVCISGFTGCESDTWDDHYDYGEENDQSLVTRLEGLPQFSQFTTYLKETGLDKVVDKNTPFTIFAPTNEAFASYNLEGVDMKSLIGNHVFENTFYLDALVDSSKIHALNDKSIRVYTNGGTEARLHNNVNDYFPSANGSNLGCKNGVIHALDEVIEAVPNMKDIIDELDQNAYAQFSTEYARLDSIDTTKVDLVMVYDIQGNPLIDTLQHKHVEIFDPANESKWKTLFLPTDEAINNQKAEIFAKASSMGYEEKTTENYIQRLIKAQLFNQLLKREELDDFEFIVNSRGDSIEIQDIDADEYKEDQIICSNGVINLTDQIFYEPLNVDFIDSIMYEAEWGLGFDGYPESATYYNKNKKKLLIKGGNEGSERFVWLDRTKPGDWVTLVIPNVPAGWYTLICSAKDKCKLTEVQLSANGEDVGNKINFDKDQPGVWAERTAGKFYHPVDGDLPITITIKKYSTYKNSLSVDYIKLMAVEK